MSKTKVVIKNISFKPEIIEAIDIQAQDEHRSRSSMIEVMAINYIKKYEQKNA